MNVVFCKVLLDFHRTELSFMADIEMANYNYNALINIKEKEYLLKDFIYCFKYFYCIVK